MPFANNSTDMILTVIIESHRMILIIALIIIYIATTRWLTCRAKKDKTENQTSVIPGQVEPRDTH